MWKDIYDKIKKNYHPDMMLEEYLIMFNKAFGFNFLEGEVETSFDKLLLTVVDSEDFYLQINRDIADKNFKNIISFFMLVSQKIDRFKRFSFPNVEEYDDFFSNNAFFKKIYFCPEFLLKDNDEKGILMFLFIFFNPLFQKHKIFIHPVDEIPLTSYPILTPENFKMILFLMENEAPDFYEWSKYGYNLNHQMISYFIENEMPSNNFYKKKDINWIRNGFPVYKIRHLINAGFLLDDFVEIREQQMFFTEKNLENTIAQIVLEENIKKLNTLFADSEKNKKRVKI